jgi:hypothetical protein
VKVGELILLLQNHPPDSEVVVEDPTGDYASDPLRVRAETWPGKWDEAKEKWVRNSTQIVTIVMKNESSFFISVDEE